MHLCLFKKYLYICNDECIYNCIITMIQKPKKHTIMSKLPFKKLIKNNYRYNM